MSTLSDFAKLKPAHFHITKVIRPNILALQPYRCARDDYDSGILLDANENALGHSIVPSSSTPLEPILSKDLHRYPSPSHDDIKQRIVELRNLKGIDRVFLGVGSDEVIDLLMRVCVQPGKERILITPPTYGMYKVCAQVNDVGVACIPLELTARDGEGGERGRFSLNADEVKLALFNDPTIKLVFLCSPGNPTGTKISIPAIRSILEYPEFRGIVVVDEAYIDFAGAESSAVQLVEEFANLCVMQTLSKGFGLAAIRLGIAIAQPPLIQILTNTKAPYNISTPTAYLALSALSPESLSAQAIKIKTMISSRAKVLSDLTSLSSLGLGPPLGGNNANFVLIPILTEKDGEPDNKRAERVYKILAEEEGVVVRFRGNEMGCGGCLRITIGTEQENEVLLRKFRDVLQRVGKDGETVST